MTNDSLSTTTKKKLMIEALERSMGIVTTACQAVGISRATHYLWMNIDEHYKASVAMVENSALDFAESKLFQKISEGDVAATIFFLKTKGKHRGYTLKRVWAPSIPSLASSSQAEYFRQITEIQANTAEIEANNKRLQEPKKQKEDWK